MYLPICDNISIYQTAKSDPFRLPENDDERRPNEKVLLREAFDAAGVTAEIEVYEGALHGWCPPDSAVYHEAQAERAWSRMLKLFERTLA